MPRPQAADYPQRREAILHEAAALFAHRGFASASVARLAAACGSSKSLIYHYFASKEGILYAVMASHIEALGAAAAEAVAGPGLAEDRLGALMVGFVQLYVGAGDRQKVLLNELDKLPADQREAIVRLQRGLIGILERLLAEVEPGLAGDPARMRAAAMLVFGMINWTHTWYDPAGPVGPNALANMVTGMALRGVAGTVTPSSEALPRSA